MNNGLIDPFPFSMKKKRERKTKTEIVEMNIPSATGYSALLNFFPRRILRKIVLELSGTALDSFCD